MVTAKLYGGLGNQMFQIAAAEALAKRNNDVAVFDLDDCVVYHQGNPSTNYEKTIFRNIQKENTFFQKMKSNHTYMGSEYIEIPYTQDVLLDGYFQSEKYFSDQSVHIRNLFTFNDDLIEQVNNYLNTYKSGGQVTAIHVRRGDYIKFQHIHPLCTKEYYNAAMSIFPHDNFIIISDDPIWCQENFKGSNIHYSPSYSDVFDLCLLSRCDNAVIANSSFGWWGSWLNDNPNKKIVAPRLWFGNCDFERYKDIYTENMIII